MSEGKDIKTEILGDPFAMRKKAKGIFRDFGARCKKDDSEFMSANGERLLLFVRNAEKALRIRERIPLRDDGMPYLYRLSEMMLSSSKKALTQSTIGEALHAVDEKHRFYDSELLLFPAILTLSAAELYARNGKLHYAETILRLEDIDFSAVFFAFSEVERIFMKEAVGVYQHSDDATRNLYHMRLARLAEKKNADPLACAQEIIEDANQKGTHIGALLSPQRGIFPKLYFHSLFGLIFSFLALAIIKNGIGLWNLLLLPLLFFSSYSVSKLIASSLFSSKGENALPKIISGEALEKTKTLVCIATFLYGEEKDGKIFDKLEDFYLTNTEQTTEIIFGVVGDLPQSKRRKADKDDAILSYAKKRIDGLRAKYGEHFALFVRGRRHSESEGAYIGWERKRGSVLEVCRFLRGKKTSFLVKLMNEAICPEIQYLVTLDADTNLYTGAVRDLVGTMLHPENKPIFNAEKRIVVSGHAVIQPRMIPTLSSASATAFAALTGGKGGIDAYSSAGSDLYQNLFDEGIYCGKGILDIDIFLKVCDGFFPKERILSHDLAEGNLLRSALAPKIVLSDGTPKNAISYYIREHRWIRGDLQIMPYLWRYVRNETGERVENPMSRLSKYKILDNFLRAATPLFSLLALFLGAFFGSGVLFRVALIVFSPLLFSVACAMISEVRCHGFGAVFRAWFSSFFHVGTLAWEAFLFADALIRTLYRFFVSHKNFLNWTTASSGDSAKHGYLDDYILRFSPSMIIGLVFFCFSGALAKFFGLLWIGMPFFLWILSREKKNASRICARDRATLQRYTHDAWLFFRDHVNESTKGLPPDNIQLFPTYASAKRTSPTNIGLYLLSLLAARDFEYIDSTELWKQSAMTAKTLSSLLKWNGHLYNWYSTDTLSVLGEAFVSTVDSGNLVASLVAFCEGLKEYAGEESRLLDVISVLNSMISETDFRALYDENAKLFYIGYHVKNGTYSSSHYDTFMSEARITSYYAAATRSVSAEHYFKPSRRVIGSFGRYGIASWSGTAFEYFMPSLFLPTVKSSLSSYSLSYAYRAQRKNTVKKTILGKKRSVFGVSESGYFSFDGAMNYQYHAFGTENLSLDPMVRAEHVVSPYASFLMLEEDPEGIAENLRALESLDMYGKYGFYEAIDFESARVGDGYARIQSYMSHHIGMSIVSAANLLKNGIFRKRFLKNPAMRASSELLSERMPTVLIPYSVKKRIKREEKEVYEGETFRERAPQYAYTLMHPEMAMVTNNKTKILASSSGHIAIENGADTLCFSDFDLYALGGGLRIYVNIDGIVLPTVPLMAPAEGFSSRFAFVPRADAVEYRSHHVGRKNTYDIMLRLSVYPDRELCDIVCDVKGSFESAFALLYFEPIITKKREYLAHKSFSGLFLSSEYHSDENTLLFARRPRSDRLSENYLGVKVSPCRGEGFYETMRDKLLPLMPSEGAYRKLCEKTDFTDSHGAMIVPACAIKSAEIGMRKGRIVYTIGASDDADDLLYDLSGFHAENKRMRRLKMGDLLNLQYRAASLSRSVLPLERFLLRCMAFGQIRPRSENFRFVDKNAFWRFSVSGDNPIVLASYVSENAEARLRLQELIALFKYMCIRGVRYDLVIFYRETDDYNRIEYKKITEALHRAGCEKFLSWSCGIFPINVSLLTPQEKFSYELACTAHFDLSCSLFEIASENARAVSVSAEAESLLKKEIITSPIASEKPKLEEIHELSSGSFHTDGFLVKKPHGKAPFAHILASQNFGSVLTENSLGFTYARNSGLKKLTPHTADAMTEDQGERLILRIYDAYSTKKYRDFDLCAVSAWVDWRFGTAVYHGEADGVRFRIEVALLGKSDVKVMEVTLESNRKVRVAMAFAVRPALGDAADGNRFYRFCKERDGIRIVRYSDGGMKNGELLVFSPNTTSVYTERAAFYTDGALFRGESDAAVLLSRTELFGKRTFRFYLCAVFSERHLHSIREQCQKPHLPIEVPFFHMISLKTENILLDEIVNKWTLYQAVYSRIWARSGFYQVSGAFGFRDQLQDALALIQIAPQMTKTIIFRAAAHQYEEGDVQHFWHPEGAGLRTRCSDDYVWLPFVTAEYVKQTGDLGILFAELPYLTSAVLADEEEDRYESPARTNYKETLWLHLLRAVKNADRFGAHRLPLIGSCDWNDGMNGVGRKGKGESVWLAFFLALVYERMAELARLLSKDDAIYHKKKEILLDAIREHGYDGAWYRRGYYDDGSPLGSALRKDCKIDVIAQAFAGIAAEALSFEKGRALSSMNAVCEYLFDREHQIIKLLTPPFVNDEQSPGYIKGYVAGIRENGGQYTHAAVWAALGFFGCGENELGAQALLAINPAVRAQNHEIEKAYRIEPYVFAGDVYANEDHPGRGGWSWYTGSAAWYRRAVIEWLCGYREEQDGFAIMPRLSSSFSSFKLRVCKKNTSYQVEARFGQRRRVTIDGKVVPWGYHFKFDGGNHRICLEYADLM